MPSEIKQLHSVKQHAHTTQHAEQVRKILSLNPEERNAITPNLWDLHQNCSVRLNEISQLIQTTLRSSYVLHSNLPALSLTKLSSAMTVKWAVATATTALVAIVAAPRIYNASPELLKNLPFFNRIEESAAFIPQDVLSDAFPDEFPAFKGTQTATTPLLFEFVPNAIPMPTPLPLLSLEARDEKNSQILNPAPNSNAVPPPPFETRVEQLFSNPKSLQVASTDSNILDFSSRTAAYLASIAAAAVLFGFRGQLNRQLPQIKQISAKVQKEMNRLLAPGNPSIKRFLKKIGGAFSALLFSTEPQTRPHPHQQPPKDSYTRGTAAFSMRQDPKTAQNFNQLQMPPHSGESSSSSSRSDKGKGPAQQNTVRKRNRLTSQSAPSTAQKQSDDSIYLVTENSDDSPNLRGPSQTPLTLSSQAQSENAEGGESSTWATQRRANNSRRSGTGSIAQWYSGDTSPSSTDKHSNNYWEVLAGPSSDSGALKGSGSSSSAPPPLPVRDHKPLIDTSAEGSSSQSDDQQAEAQRGSLLGSLQQGKNLLKKTSTKDGTPRKATERRFQKSGFRGNERMIAIARANGGKT